MSYIEYCKYCGMSKHHTSFCPMKWDVQDNVPFKVSIPSNGSYEDHTNGPYATEDAPNPLSYQIGGDHYKDFKIQPIQFIMDNELSFCEGNVVKYICRHSKKHGLEDLKKVIHYAKLEAKKTYGVDI